MCPYRYLVLSQPSFSCGIPFLYWDWYKHKTINQLQQKQEEYNINDYGGYSIQDLYVERKYRNFKTELLRHITIKQYKDILFLKAQKYFEQSEKVKKLKANDKGDGGDQDLHYGIDKGSKITLSHIISMIMYTDFTDYCTNFSSTFRPLSASEHILSVKIRNEEFWWQSKLLRETVEIFGAMYRNREFWWQSKLLRETVEIFGKTGGYYDYRQRKSV